MHIPGADRFAIDMCDVFGLSSASGVYSSSADGGVNILQGSGIGPLSKWVNDHVFTRIRRETLARYNAGRKALCECIAANGGRQQSGGRYWFSGRLSDTGRIVDYDDDNIFPLCDCSADSPRSAEDAKFTYCFADIDCVTNALGIPWETSKDVPFTSKVPFTGLLWDLEVRCMSLTQEKRTRYLDTLQLWRQTRVHNLLEVQQMYGKLLHATLVIPEGCAYLTGLESMLGIFGESPHKPRSPPSSVCFELEWWCATLSCPILDCSIPGPITVVDHAAFSDASSEIGVGVVIGGRLLPGWRTLGCNTKNPRDISWAEAVGFELLTRSLLAAGTSDCALNVYGDNRGVVEGWWNHRSKNPHINRVFRRIHTLLNSSRASIHTHYVPSRFNPADGPSCSSYPPGQLLLPPLPIPDELQLLLCNFDNTPLDTEVDLRRRHLNPVTAPCIHDDTVDHSRAASNDSFDTCGAELHARNTLTWG